MASFDTSEGINGIPATEAVPGGGRRLAFRPGRTAGRHGAAASEPGDRQAGRGNRRAAVRPDQPARRADGRRRAAARGGDRDAAGGAARAASRAGGGTATASAPAYCLRFGCALSRLAGGAAQPVEFVRTDRVRAAGGHPNEQLALIAAGEIDLGIGHPPFDTHARLASVLLANDRFDAVLPADHRLAGRAAIRVEELATEPLVLFPEAQGPALYAAIRDRCRVAGRSIQVAATAPRLHGQLSLVAAGLGIGLARTQSRSLEVAGTVRVPLKPYPAAMVLPLAALYDPRSRHPALPLALAALRRAVAARAGGARRGEGAAMTH
ncbi:hypothetical protein F1599_16015 [Cupriavidus cauae]|uniref:LysR substrate-binding domain-containing protein n=1 Tax=Cupriavidus cauae TaxID=2608999 RepID=A0A5M8ABZ7_9BURK|nr:hypothetical protein F1599_16015 [Cupriavidus cauae]